LPIGTRVDLKALSRWLTKGFWAVSDQGLFSLSNFAMSVLLARWLVPQDFGAFTVAFAVFLLMGTFHTALLTEPMLVFGPSRHEGRFSEYLGALMYGHLGFAVLSSLLLLLAGLGFAHSGQSEVSAALIALALSGPFILLLWLMRRACYACFEPHLATSGGVLYMALMLGGLYALYRLEWLSAASALEVMGFSSLAVSLWLYVRLRVDRPASRDSIVRGAFEDHWRYGRWSVATGMLLWIPAEAYYLLLPIWGGLEAGASMRALLNLIMPAVQAITALGVLLLPALAQARGQARFGSLVRLILVPFVLGPVLYWLLLGMLHQPLIVWIYGGRYAEHSDLLWIMGLTLIANGVIVVIGGSLRALERPDRVFFAYAISALVTATVGVGLTFLWGITGATVGLLISYSTTTVMMLFFYWRLKDKASKVKSRPQIHVRANRL
jgi:O-antigen/teichoic acid export membrane protein